MTMAKSGSLVDAHWLKDHLDAPDVVVVDASWHLPTEQRDAKAEYLEQHIPGTVFFDIDDISDTSSDLPHMLPDNAKFASKVRKLGIGDGMRIVVYDTVGMFSAARVWWMFRVMGAQDVILLDGGMPKWLEAGYSTEIGPVQRQERHFTVRRNMAIVRDVDDILDITKGSDIQIVDARAEARFRGDAPEPRAGLRAGHIPGARTVPFTTLLNDDRTLRSRDEMAAIFEDAGVSKNRPIVTSCGSGVTAAILSFALEELGHRNVSLYDGSWTEWGSREDLPIATGPAD